MKNVMIAFEFDENDRIPVGHTLLTLHMVFDIKITLDRKARLVADGHKVPELPKQLTYSTVPSRDSIRLFFLLAALNGLDVLSADIQNAYLSSPISEKYYCITGDEFPKELRGRPVKVVRALYGLPVAGKSFTSFLASNLRKMGYSLTAGDKDVWMKPAVKPNGDRYYQYLIAYIDDIICCGVNPQEQMDIIGAAFTLKEGSVGEPTMYLGADITKTVFDDDGKARWCMG